MTGFAGLTVIDDPVKSRAEAESQTYRDNIWDWFNDDIYTRLEPNGKVILIQTRWHEDDLAGRLLRESNEDGGEKWEVVNLPALAESVSPPYEGRVADASSDGVVLSAEASPIDLRKSSAFPQRRLKIRRLCRRERRHSRKRSF